MGTLCLLADGEREAEVVSLTDMPRRAPMQPRKVTCAGASSSAPKF